MGKESAQVLADELDSYCDKMEIDKLTSALKQEASEMSPDEARYIVDAYYQIQENRKAAANQIRSAEGPCDLLNWLCGNMAAVENRIKALLNEYAKASLIGQWAMSIHGIGPVISAGMLAYVDIRKAKTAGSVWRYAGLDPSISWEKGQKRPWNASLKVLVWKFADVQYRFQNAEKNFYGPLIAEYKQELQRRNKLKEYAEAAAAVLAKKPDHKQASIYKEGLLPPAHIHARALRWGAKLFVSHWHEVAWRLTFGEEPPKPYAMAILGHDLSHKINPPNWPMVVKA